MSLTMTDEREKDIREDALCDAAFDDGVRDLIAELDATRAALAEREADLKACATALVLGHHEEKCESHGEVMTGSAHDGLPLGFRAACAAATRAMGTRNGEQLT